MIRLNVVNVFLLTRYFLDDMLARNEGHIVNISSGVSLQPMPMMTTYSATKAFVRQMTESLYYELKYRKTAVQVTAVCPAAIKNTAFQQQADMDNVNTFKGLFVTTPEVVARDTYAGMKAGKRIVITGPMLRAGNVLKKVTPGFIAQYAIKKEMERK